VAKGTSSKDVLAVFQKSHGLTVGSFGGSLVDVSRLPSGIFAFDLATGGGFPRGKASMVYGPESSGKTNLILRSLAMHQFLYPDLTCVFFDIENSFDPVWAKLMGVDTDRLIVVQPSYAEQCVDMVESFLCADDCGLVVVDSIAALVTTNEADSSAEKAVVGGSSNPVGKMVRKTTLALAEASKMQRYPTLIYVNQIRHKIGVMFGDPETMTGGNAPKFQVGLLVRLYGKNKMDPKISKVMPVLKEVSFVLKKWKVPVLAANGAFEMAMVAHDDLGVGECDDFSTVHRYLEDFGQFEKGDKGKGWVILGEAYATQQLFRDRLYQDKQFGAEVREALIKRALQEGVALKETA
jgi:recombination protein RecA